MNNNLTRATPAALGTDCRGEPAEIVPVAVVAAWSEIETGRSVLVTRRAAGSHLGGMWELPGGKIEACEAAAATAMRELAEETGLTAVAVELLVRVEHDYFDRRVQLHAFVCQINSEDMDCVRCVGGHRWVPVDELQAIEFPQANHQITAALVRRLQGTSES